MDGRLVIRGRQAKFLPIEKYPKVWELAIKFNPFMTALMKRQFARKMHTRDAEGFSGLVSEEGQQMHFEDLFVSTNGDGKMICTPKIQNWFDSLQGLTLHRNSSVVDSTSLVLRHAM